MKVVAVVGAVVGDVAGAKRRWVLLCQQLCNRYATSGLCSVTCHLWTVSCHMPPLDCVLSHAAGC